MAFLPGAAERSAFFASKRVFLERGGNGFDLFLRCLDARLDGVRRRRVVSENGRDLLLLIGIENELRPHSLEAMPHVVGRAAVAGELRRSLARSLGGSNGVRHRLALVGRQRLVKARERARLLLVPCAIRLGEGGLVGLKLRGFDLAGLDRRDEVRVAPR